MSYSICFFLVRMEGIAVRFEELERDPQTLPIVLFFFNPEPEKLISQTNRVTLEKLSHIWTDLTHNNRCK